MGYNNELCSPARHSKWDYNNECMNHDVVPTCGFVDKLYTCNVNVLQVKMLLVQ